MMEISWTVLLGAYILDFLLGDPKRLPHPVIYMGKAIDFLEDPFRKFFKDPMVAGGFFAGSLILFTWAAAAVTVIACMGVHPVFGTIVQIVLLFFCFSSKSLEKAALAVFHALEKESLDTARKAVSYIVGRNTQNLDQKGVNRACVETVAENFVDGFLSPLFFAVIGGVPLALAYKMVNTLDSMIGYKNDAYILFGRPAARIDDAANFIPARISVVIIAFCAALLSFKRGVSSLKTGFFQGSRHKSPNAGYPEAAFSGALRIRLGGPSWYHGQRVEKPFIGSEFKDPETQAIPQACDLMVLASFCATLFSCTLVVLFQGG